MYVLVKKEIDGFNDGAVAHEIVVNKAKIYTTDADRCVGKSTMILKIADLFGKPILTTNYGLSIFYEKEARDRGLTNVKVVYVNSPEALRGSSYSDFLVDESVSNDFLLEARKNAMFSFSGFMHERC